MTPHLDLLPPTGNVGCYPETTLLPKLVRTLANQKNHLCLSTDTPSHTFPLLVLSTHKQDLQEPVTFLSFK